MFIWGTRETTKHVTNSTTSFTSDSQCILQGRVDHLAYMERNLEVIAQVVPEYATIDDVPLRW